MLIDFYFFYATRNSHTISNDLVENIQVLLNCTYGTRPCATVRFRHQPTRQNQQSSPLFGSCERERYPSPKPAQFSRSSVMCRGSGLSSLRSTRLTMSVSTALALQERP